MHVKSSPIVAFVILAQSYTGAVPFAVFSEVPDDVKPSHAEEHASEATTLPTFLDAVPVTLMKWTSEMTTARRR